MSVTGSFLSVSVDICFAYGRTARPLVEHSPGEQGAETIQGTGQASLLGIVFDVNVLTVKDNVKLFSKCFLDEFFHDLSACLFWRSDVISVVAIVQRVGPVIAFIGARYDRLVFDVLV